MLKQTTLLITASLVWTSATLAAEPLVSPVPMPEEASGMGSRGSEASDLPAPSTTSWVNKPLLVTSTIVLVAAYVPVAAVGFTSDRPADQTNLYYPVVGPWMNLSDRQCDSRPCSNESMNKALLIASGVGQGLGALGLLLSLALPGATTNQWYLVGDNGFHVTPSNVGNTGYGLTTGGTF